MLFVDPRVLSDVLHGGGAVELPPAAEAELLPDGVEGVPDGTQHTDTGTDGRLSDSCKTRSQVICYYHSDLAPLEERAPTGFLAFLRSVTLKS